jgi:hypothetical protein
MWMVIDHNHPATVVKLFGNAPLGAPAIDGPCFVLLADHLLNQALCQPSLLSTLLGMVGPGESFDS